MTTSDELNPLVPHPVEIALALGMLLGLVTLCLLVVALVVSRTGARTGVTREERAVRTIRGMGLVVGVVLAGWVLLEPTPFDRGLGSAAVVAPLVLGVVLLVAVLLGELVVRPRHSGGARTASLRPRRLRDPLPRRLTRLVGAMTVAAVLLCTYTALTASPDDTGRAGRALFAQCTATVSSGRGPYPGSFYVVPYLVGLAVVAVVAVLAALRISHRTLGADAVAEERYRLAGLTSVVSAYGLTLSAPFAGISFFAGTALLGHSCPQTGWKVVGIAALALTLCSVGTALVCLLGVLAPGALGAADTTRDTERHEARA